MVLLYECKICHSKIVESRVKKHHAKVHPNNNYDIYTEVYNSESKTSAPLIDFDVWNIEASKDDSVVHVSCSVCKNRMPIGHLDAHMARKHNDTDDQVDAIGTQANAIPKPNSSDNKLVREFLINQSKQKNTGPSPMKPESFGSSEHFQPTPDPKTSTNEPVFYTIRVSEAQMQQLLDQNRIIPKNGFLHLK